MKADTYKQNKMNQNNEQSLRDTYRFGQLDFEIYDLIEERNNFPLFPFAINIPVVLFTQNQLQNFMVRFYQMLRSFELENMFNFPQTNTPYGIFCGYCNSIHIIDAPLNQASRNHLSTGVIVTPYWFPFSFRPTLQVGDNLRREE